MHIAPTHSPLFVLFLWFFVTKLVFWFFYVQSVDAMASSVSLNLLL